MRTTQKPTPIDGAIHEHLDASGMPVDLRHRTWQDATAGEHLDDARQWAAGELRGLWLEGPVGVGKTGVAAPAAYDFMHHRSLRWISAPLLQAKLTAGFGTTLRDDALAVLTRSDALVIDDIDKVRAGDETLARALFVAIDGRVNAGTSLLITSNQSLGALAKLLPDPWGETIGSRIAGYCTRHVLHGDDRRTAA